MAVKALIRGQGSMSLRLYFTIAILLMAQLATTGAQAIDGDEEACYYLDIVFSSCWTRRGSTPYTANEVAQCACTVGPDIDIAVPACSAFIETAEVDSPITSFATGYESYCSSYAPGYSVNPIPTSTPINDQPDTAGANFCQAILNNYLFCAENPEDDITDPGVASCLCHDSFGDFTTGFDELLTPCYEWAMTSDPSFATDVSSIFGFCTDYGTADASPTEESGPRFTFTTPTSTRMGTLTFSQIDDDVASSACETVARIASACRTGESDPLTRAAVANCICQDPNNTGRAFGTEFDKYLTNCYPYARTKSPDAASEILSLSGYCTRFADGGKTYTLTATTQDATETVTQDVIQTSAQTTSPNISRKNKVPVGFVATIPLVIAMFDWS